MTHMIRIDYPPHEFRIKKNQGKEFIFDEIRKVWLRLSPEEWVRQNFVRYLIAIKNYPSSMIALEKKIMVGELPKRFDILVYDKAHHPWLMVECKSMEIPLSEEVFSQVLRYNIGVPVHYLVITNGTSCMAFRKEQSQLSAIAEIPSFEN